MDLIELLEELRENNKEIEFKIANPQLNIIGARTIFTNEPIENLKLPPGVKIGLNKALEVKRQDGSIMRIDIRPINLVNREFFLPSREENEKIYSIKSIKIENEKLRNSRNKGVILTGVFVLSAFIMSYLGSPDVLEIFASIENNISQITNSIKMFSELSFIPVLLAASSFFLTLRAEIGIIARNNLINEILNNINPEHREEIEEEEHIQ